MDISSTGTVAETRQQRFERLLGQEPFKGLKAILYSLSLAPEALCDAVVGTSSFDDLLARLGYPVTVTRQIHVADCYTRTGRGGEITAVLPYFDIPTQSALPTLINANSTVTVTPKSAAFFNALLAELKRQMAS